jgi:ATP-dependent DNA helicase RecG
MDTNTDKLLALIRKGEGPSLEFKACRDQLNRDVYESVCAFLNRHGGTLLLGVNDQGEVKGVDPQALPQIKKDFVTAINNPQKISPPTYLSIDEVTVKGKRVLHIYVPESSQVHRCNGRIFDRNEDADVDITDRTTLVAQLYLRKQATYSENKIYPHILMTALRADLIEKCRKIARVNSPGHPWASMDNLQILQSAQLYQTDPQTGESGVTLAGILLLGTDQLILTVCPAHRTDLLLRKVNVDRYDDRDLVRTNLIDSYDRIIAFVQKHLPDPFYLEDMERISLRDAIFREVASNMLIHREYLSGIPARLIIEYAQVVTENANRPHGFGALNPAMFAPYPKNPVIGAFFREIHRADELGSGMRNMMKYGKTYGGADPQLIEGDLFRMIIKVPEYVADEVDGVREATPAEAQDEAQDKAQDEAQDLNETELRMLSACQHSPCSTAELLQKLGYVSRTGNFKKALTHLIDEVGALERTLPEAPTSKHQKYRLTETGAQLLLERKAAH